MRCAIFFLVVLSGPAMAGDPCHDLWFTRNLIFDRAGYCFDSMLGQTVFDNSDCTTKSPVITAEDKATIAQIRETEDWIGCAVDTSGTDIQIDALGLRRALDTLPVLDGLESTCIGWRGPVISLYSGVQAGARQIGKINPGDTLHFDHELLDPFSFVTVTSGGTLVSLGWSKIPTGGDVCEQWAG